MRVRGFNFEFQIPDSWTVQQEPGRVVLKGPKKEEAIVSGGYVGAAPDPAGLARLTDELLQSAIRAMERVTAHPDLKVTRPLKKESGGVECWTLAAETRDGLASLQQAAFRGDHGVMLVTLEAPADAGGGASFNRLLASVRPAVAA